MRGRPRRRRRRTEDAFQAETKTGQSSVEQYICLYLPLFGFTKRTYFLGIFMARKRCAVKLREIVPETVKVIP